LFVLSPEKAFFLLGTVVLCVTGTEALYADMGHFGRGPIRLAWYGVVFPALLLTPSCTSTRDRPRRTINCRRTTWWSWADSSNSDAGPVVPLWFGTASRPVPSWATVLAQVWQPADALGGKDRCFYLLWKL